MGKRARPGKALKTSKQSSERASQQASKPEPAKSRCQNKKPGLAPQRRGRRHWAAALKSGHRGASDPVVRDTAEGLGPQGLPSGIGPAALCRRPPPTMSRPCAIILRWARPYKGRRISGFVQAIFAGFLSISPRSQKTSVFWGVRIVDSIPGITCIIRILGGH